MNKTPRQCRSAPHWAASAALVLHAEDDEDDRFLFERALREVLPEHRYLPLPDGEAARHYLEGTHGYECRQTHPLPDAIVTDLKMPRMGGLTLLKWIRTHPEFESIPVFVYSGATFENEVDECLESGASGYFVKSGDNGPDQVLHALREVTSHSRDHHRTPTFM